MAHELLRLYLQDEGSPPVFSDEQLTELLAHHEDDFYSTVSEGWSIKASKVADWYNVSLDGSSLSREQVFDHCVEMAKFYGTKGGASMKNIGLTTRPETSEAEFA